MILLVTLTVSCFISLDIRGISEKSEKSDKSDFSDKKVFGRVRIGRILRLFVSLCGPTCHLIIISAGSEKADITDFPEIL